MTYTKGPWKWAEGYCGLFDADDSPVIDYADYEGMWIPYYDPEGPANARLIAASPTMFEYVKRRADESDQEAISILEQIIAKAAGAP